MRRRNVHVTVVFASLVVFLLAGPCAGQVPSRTGAMIWHSEEQVYRASDVQQFSDATAVLTGTLVNITLLVPRTVVVTFSADTFTDTNLYVGLSVNSGDCAIYGPAALTSESKFHTTTLRWIVTKDEVKAGRNSFEVCVLTGTGGYDLRTLTVERVQ